MKKVLLIAITKFSDVNRLKQLAASFPKESVICLASDKNFLGEEVQWLPLKTEEEGFFAKAGSSRFVISKNYEGYYWNQPFVKEIEQKISDSFDLVFASEIETLPVALKIAGETPVFLDVARPLEDVQGSSWGWKGFEQGMRENISENHLEKTTRVFASSEVCSDTYSDSFANIQIVNPFPKYENLSPKKTNPAMMRLVYFQKEPTFERVAPLLDIFELTRECFELDLFLGETTASDLEKIKSKAYLTGRVNIFESENSTHLSETLNRYDLAIFSPKGVETEEELYQTIQGRVGVVAFSGSRLAAVIKPYQLGIFLSGDSEACAQTLNVLDSDQIDLFKRNAHRIARHFSQEQTERVLEREFSQASEASLV